MTIVTGIMVYLVIWWIVIFCVLPFGVERNTGEYQGSGSPADPRLKKKFLITTVASFFVWLAVYGLVYSDIIDFRAISRAMIEEGSK